VHRQRALAVVAPADIHVGMVGAQLLGCLLAELLRRLPILRSGCHTGRQSPRPVLLARARNGHAHGERRDCRDGNGDDALQGAS
jgi:hypothetical protein